MAKAVTQLTLELLKVSEFAERSNLQPSTVRAWILHRKVTFVRLGGRSIRIPATELDRLIQEGLVPARVP